MVDPLQSMGVVVSTSRGTSVTRTNFEGLGLASTFTFCYLFFYSLIVHDAFFFQRVIVDFSNFNIAPLDLLAISKCFFWGASTMDSAVMCPQLV